MEDVFEQLQKIHYAVVRLLSELVIFLQMLLILYKRIIFNLKIIEKNAKFKLKNNNFVEN